MLARIEMDEDEIEEKKTMKKKTKYNEKKTTKARPRERGLGCPLTFTIYRPCKVTGCVGASNIIVRTRILGCSFSPLAQFR